MKPTRDMLQRVGAIEAAARVPNDPNRILAFLSDLELDRLEDALLRGDPEAAKETTAAAERRLAAGEPPWGATPAAARAREAERRWYWRLLPEALAEQARSGRPVNYEALEREARRRAEAAQ